MLPLPKKRGDSSPVDGVVTLAMLLALVIWISLGAFAKLIESARPRASHDKR